MVFLHFEGQIQFEQLEPDDSTGPDVDWTVLEVAAHDQFGCALVEGHDFVALALADGVHGPAESLVRYLHVESAVNQNVVRLHVPVHYLVQVDVIQPHKHLEHYHFDFLRREVVFVFEYRLLQCLFLIQLVRGVFAQLPTRVDDFLEVRLHELHDELEVAFVLQHVDLFDDLLARQHRESVHYWNLSKSRLWDSIVDVFSWSYESFHRISFVPEHDLLYFTISPFRQKSGNLLLSILVI